MNARVKTIDGQLAIVLSQEQAHRLQLSDGSTVETEVVDGGLMVRKSLPTVREAAEHAMKVQASVFAKLAK